MPLQRGVATATVCARFGLECIIYMGANDMERQKLNVFRMRLLGATVCPVRAGTATLKDATSEAIRDWVGWRRCKLDRSLKAPPPGFHQTLIVKRIHSAFNLNPLFV